MKKNLINVTLSVLVSGLTAFFIVKAATSQQASATTTSYAFDGSAYRTVNLAQNDYPDFTYAAESAVDAVFFATPLSNPADKATCIDDVQNLFKRHVSACVVLKHHVHVPVFEFSAIA